MDELDFEDELMDLDTNESAYMPPQRPSLGSRSDSGIRGSLSPLEQQLSMLSADPAAPVGYARASSTPTPTTVVPPRDPPLPRQASLPRSASPQYPPTALSVQQILEAAAQNQENVYQQARERFGSSSSSSATSSDPLASSASSLASSASSFTAAASTFVAGLISPQELRERELDEQFLRRKALIKEMTALRQQQIVERVGYPIDTSTVIVHEYPEVTAEAVEKMIEKLDTVVETSFQEMRQQQPAAAVLWTQLIQELTPLEGAYMAKAADERFEEQMKYSVAKGERETKKCIEQHLNAILVSRVPQRNGLNMGKAVHHSLGQLLQEFRSIFLVCYENFVAQHQAHQITGVLPLVAADVNQCASILVQLLLFKYPFLTQYKQFVQRCVFFVLFEQLQPTLHGIYVTAFRVEDSVFNDVAQLKRTNRVKDFGVRRIFRLDGDWGLTREQRDQRDRNELRLLSLRQYDAVIYQINALPGIRSPLVKIESLVQICHSIDATIKAYYAQHEAPPPPDRTSVTAEDLRSILAFLLVSSPATCLHVFSQLAILSSFIPPASSSGEAGFVLATLTSAVRHLIRVQ
uniref:VPS9 domain-containing protein n=1 Tax=Globisporangium ultimum (strain ATCC 200006 / CBS 805.95 / DAOM BR144) TaxID=431595 RepID=K3WL06_GLOUD